MKLKKGLSSILSITMILLLLVGCGNGDATTTTANSEGGTDAAVTEGVPADDESTIGKNTFIDGATELALWTFQELHVDFYTDMADKWNEANPDQPINLTVTNQESSAMHTKMLVALTSGEGGPDIADIEVGHFANFVDEDDVLLVPLNDVVEPEEDNVVMSRIEMYSGNDGNYYGICFHVGMSVAYYNMDIMNEAGVDPSTIVTWDDYVAAGKIVLEKTGKPMTSVETGDLFLPQCMMLEKNAQYVTEDGQPNIDTPEHAEVITYIRQMLTDGVAGIAPGGGFHEEEWYGYFNDGGAASIIMPLWYMGRFTDYMSDLDGKMAIYPIPVWNEGDTRGVTQGGTGTGVTIQSQHQDLAKEYLAYAKLSVEGNTYEWEKLGFDPIRTSLWTDPAITENADNKYLKFFATNPFDVLNEIGFDVPAPNIRGGYAATYNVITTTTYVNAFELAIDQDVNELLEAEQASIVYSD